VRFSEETPVLTLDPNYSEGATYSALSNVYEGLVSYDREMQLVPGLAMQWTTPDELTWEFELRKGVLFHDGVPLTARDVKASLERSWKDPDSSVRGAFWSVSRIEEAGEFRLRIRTTRPDAMLLNQLSQPLIVRGASKAEIEKKPVGTGPYKVKLWERGGNLELEAFPSHWAGPPRVQKATFVTIPDSEKVIKALSQGSADIAAVPARTVLMKSGKGFRIESSSGLTVQILWIRSLSRSGSRDFLSDRRVRQALSLSLDRNKLARAATGHETNRASQVIPQTVFGHDAALPPPVRDLDRAQRLLAEAGFPKGVETSLAHRNDESGHKIAGLLKEMAAEAGIRISLVPLSWEDLLSATARQEHPLYLMRWTFDSGDAGAFFRDCLRSPKEGMGVFNPGLSDPELDGLIDRSATEFASHERLDLLQAIVRRTQAEVPIIPLYFQPDVWGVSPRVRWLPRIDGRLLATEIELDPTHR
jgi:peptide/nickel transport system substrate-binding protein